MKQYLIFDFDGVLIDSFPLWIKILNSIGYTVNPEQWKAHHDGNVFETPAVAFTEESRKMFREQYYENVTDYPLIFTKNDLEKLSQQFTLFIISSNREYSIEKFLNFHEIHLFEEVLGGDFHKSKVEKFKYLFEKYHFSAEDCYFITDTLGDILEGHQAWVSTIAVDFWFHEKERLQKGKPYAMISSFWELEKILEM